MKAIQFSDKNSEPHLGHKLYAIVWLGFDGMSVCDCRSLLCSVHYRIVAEHVTQRSGMHIYVNLRTIDQLLRSGFAQQEQRHIYRIVSLKLSLSHLCSTDDFVTLPSPCDWPPCFNIYKEGVTKFRKVNQGKAVLSWKQQVKYKECSQAPFPAPDFMSFNPSSYILTVCV